MRRARHNIELIIQRLDQLGYRFWDGSSGNTAAPLMAIGGMAIPMADLSSSKLVDHVMKQLSMVPEHMRGNIDKRLRERLSKAEPLFQRMGAGAADAAAAEREKTEEARRRRAISDHLKDPHVFAPATKEDAAYFAQLEVRGLILPMSLRAWFEEVGDVNLLGTHSALSPGGIEADPLTIFSDSLRNEIDTWLEYQEAGDDTGPHEVVLSWDAKDKARQLADKTELYDYGYIVDIPDARADPGLHGERHKTTFVDYLRIAFRCGGFPGWERYPNRPDNELNFLTEGLLPI